MDEAIEEIKGMMDTLDLEKLLGNDFSGILGQLNFGNGQMFPMDSLSSNGSFGFLHELFSEMDQEEMNKMFEQGMQMLQGMDMSQMNQMFEQLDMKELEKMMEGLDMDQFQDMFPQTTPSEEKKDTEKKNSKKL